MRNADLGWVYTAVMIKYLKKLLGQTRMPLRPESQEVASGATERTLVML